MTQPSVSDGGWRASLRSRLAAVSALAWLLLAVALAIRLGAVIATPGFEPLNDPADYDRHARSIAGGQGYPESVPADGGPTAFRPPVYPHFLGAVYALTGDGVGAARVLQAGLGTLTVALVGLLAWQAWGRSVAHAAMGLAAVFPPLVLVGASLLSESLFLPLELGALVAVMAHRRSSHDLRWAAFAGLLAGLAALTRTNGAVLLLPLAIAVWPGGRPRVRSAAPAAILLAVAALVIAPWTARNVLVLDAFVPVSTQAAFTLAGTYNDTARADPRFPAAWRNPAQDPAYSRLLARGAELSEVELAEEFRSAVVDDVSEHPTYVLEVGLHNTARFLHLDGGDYARLGAEGVGLDRSFADAGVYAFYAVAALALVGAFTARARQAPGFLWLAAALLATVVFMVGIPRLRAPIEPFLILLASLALAAVRDRVDGRRPVARAA